MIENRQGAQFWTLSYDARNRVVARTDAAGRSTSFLYDDADRITRIEADAHGEDVEREIPFMKGYSVFNVEQIDGLPDHYTAKPEPKGEPLQLLESAERFFAATGATFRHGGNMAYYAPGPDLIQLPPPEAFRDAESYAATKAHELTHNAAPRIMPRRARSSLEFETFRCSQSA